MSDIDPTPAPLPANGDLTTEGPTGAAPHEQQPQANADGRSGPRGNRPGGRGQPRSGGRNGPARAPREPKAPAPPKHPVLQQLAELEPTLFGGEAVPMKRGIFQDLMAAHPEAFEKEALKTALGLYTRSTRYLLAMASGQQRHNLAGQPVEAVAPEHRYHSLLETFRRRHARTGQDVRQPLYARIVQAAEESSLMPADYAALVRGKDEAANEILDAAMAELGSRVAREQALLRAFDASGQTVNAFADAYGLHPVEAAATLSRAKARAEAMQAAAEQAAAAAETANTQAATAAAVSAAPEATEAPAEAAAAAAAAAAATTQEAPAATDPAACASAA